MVTSSSPIIISSWLFILIWLLISIVSSVTTATLTLATIVIIFIVITFYLFLASHFTSATDVDVNKSQDTDGKVKVKCNSDADDSSIQSKGSSSTAKGTCRNVSSRRTSRSSRRVNSRRKSSSCSSTYPLDDDFDDDDYDDDYDGGRHHTSCKNYKRKVSHHRRQVNSKDDNRLSGSEVTSPAVDGKRSQDEKSGDAVPDDEDEDAIASRDDLIKRMVRSSRLSAYYKLKQHRQSMAYGNATGLNSYYNQSPCYYTGHTVNHHQQQQQAHHQMPQYWYPSHQSTLNYPSYNSRYYSSDYYTPYNQLYYTNTSDTRSASSSRSSYYPSRDYSHLPSYNVNYYGKSGDSRLSNEQRALYQQRTSSDRYSRYASSTPTNSSYIGECNRSDDINERSYLEASGSVNSNYDTQREDVSSSVHVKSVTNASGLSRRVSSASSPPSLPIKYSNNYNPSGVPSRYRLRSPLSAGQLSTIDHRSSSSSSANIVNRSKSPPIVEEDDTASSTASPSSLLNSPAATDSTLTQSSTSTLANLSTHKSISNNTKLIIDTSQCTIVPPSIPPRPRTLPSQLNVITDVIDENICYDTDLNSNNKCNITIKSDTDTVDQISCEVNENKSDTNSVHDNDQAIVSSCRSTDQITVNTDEIRYPSDLDQEKQFTQKDLSRDGDDVTPVTATLNQIRRGPWSLSADSSEIRIRKSRASLRRSNALTIPPHNELIVEKCQRVGKNNSTESTVSTDPNTDSCDSIHRQSSEEIYDTPVGNIMSPVSNISDRSGTVNSRIRPSFRKSTSLLKQAHLQNSSSFERDCSEGLSDAGTSISRSLSRQTTFSSITKDNDRISARTGYLEISHTYDPPSKKLIVSIIEATELILYPIRGLSGSISLGTGIDLSACSLDENRALSGVTRRTPSPLTASTSTSNRVDSSSTLTASNALPSKTSPNTLLTAYKLKKSASAVAGTQNVHLILVRMALLPLKRNKVKTKSKCISFDGTVRFNEQFTFNRINPDEMIRMGCRFRVYLTQGKMRRQSLIGEANLPFVSAKPLQHETKTKLPLLSTRSSFLRANSRSSDTGAMLTRSESTCSTNSMYSTSPSGGNKLHAAELLLALSFNSASGRLVINVLRGSNMYARNGPSSRSAPDSYVKLILVSPTGREIARNKTSIKKCQLNPIYKESFTFQVPLFELQDVTLLVHAYQKYNLQRKELIGWLALGANSSSEEQLTHWNDIVEAKGDQVSRWHVLHSSKS